MFISFSFIASKIDINEQKKEKKHKVTIQPSADKTTNVVICVFAFQAKISYQY